MKKQALVLLCMLFCALLMFGCNNQSTQEDNLQNPEDAEKKIFENIEITAATPDETGARPAQIPGFTIKKELSSVPMPYIIKGTSLQLISVGNYSGEYTEDGSDDSVTDISAVVVQNTGQKCIKNATVVLVGKDAEEYVFAVTTLPAGCSMLVLESHRSSWQEEEYISRISGVSEEIEELELHEDKLDISFDDGKFKVRNLTDQDFRAVYIRYKNYTAGNVYMGGVTYSATIDNVAAQGEYACESVHYYDGHSKILMVHIVE